MITSLGVLYKKYHHSLLWNTVESLSYRSLYLFFQLWLFSKVDATQFGHFGTIFSLLYLIKYLTNFGLNQLIYTFFKEASYSKYAYKKIILPQCFIQLFLLLACSIGIFCASLYVQQGVYLAVLFSLIYITESTRSILRTLKKMAFLNRSTALIEFLYIVVYISLVFASYALGFALSVHTVFIPVLFSSIVTTLLLICPLYNWYQQLPEKNDKIIVPSLKQLLECRVYNFARIGINSLFSSNFLVPLFAGCFGYSLAGELKLISSITHFITIVIHKIFDSAQQAVLTHVSNLDKTRIFSYISTIIYHVLFAIIIFFIINYPKILPHSGYSKQLGLLAILYFIIQLSESLFITLNALFISEKKSNWLLLFTALPLSFCAIIFYYQHSLNPILILLLLLFVRLLSFVFLIIFSHCYLQIKSFFKVQPKYLVPFFIFSLVIYFLW